jgi:NAD(P)-dependent dehydrogenase (short-subunit alcohol dehydrogenase family)
MPAADVFTPGSTALITGGASGVGLAIAKLCRSKGMKLVLVDVNIDALEDAKKELGKTGSPSDIVTATTDVSQVDAWAELNKAAISTFGSIELLVLNAGVGARGTWGDQEYFNKVCLDNSRPQPPESTRPLTLRRFSKPTCSASSTASIHSCP